MYHITIHKVIAQLIKVFQFVGFWEVEHETARSRRVKTFIFVFFTSLPVTIGLGLLKAKNKEDNIYLAVCSIELFVQATRLFYIIWRKNKILSLLQQIVTFAIEDRKEFDEVNDNLNRSAKVVKWFFTLLPSGLSIFFVGCAWKRSVPFDILFPLDGFWSVYTYIVIEIIWSYLVFLVNAIIWYLMLGLKIKYILLGSQFRRMGVIKATTVAIKNKSRGQISEAMEEHLFWQDFTAAVQSYQRIKESVTFSVKGFIT